MKLLFAILWVLVGLLRVVALILVGRRTFVIISFLDIMELLVVVLDLSCFSTGCYKLYEFLRLSFNNLIILIIVFFFTDFIKYLF